jgi:competence protein ComEA
MRRQQAELAVTLRSHGGSAAFERETRGPVQVALLDARRRAWAPLAVRALAVALALIGLAGIGSVAGRAPELGRWLEPGVGSSARLAQLGAVDRVIGFPGAPPPPERSSVASSGLAQEAPAPAQATLEAQRQSGGALCPCGADVAGEPPRVPRATVSDAPRASAGARARPRAPEPDATLAPAASAAPALTADGRVVLNRATVSELMRLPGVGAKRAAAIVEQRQRLGRYREASELLRIKGIGPRTLERLLPQLVLD